MEWISLLGSCASSASPRIAWWCAGGACARLPRRAKRSSRVFVAASRCRPPVWRGCLRMFVKRRGMLLQRPVAFARRRHAGWARRGRAPGLPFRAPVEGLPPAARVCARQCGLRAGIPALAGLERAPAKPQRLDFVCCDEGATASRHRPDPRHRRTGRVEIQARATRAEVSAAAGTRSGCRRARKWLRCWRRSMAKA